MNARRQQQRGFTLVEVVLAILIISAIMSVLFYFYHRAVEVRQTVLEEAEFLSVSRMLMEQVTGELRTARTVEDQSIGLEGTSNSITFICTSIPLSPRWATSTNESVALPPLTDLKRVTYRLMVGTNSMDIRGVDRTEELHTGVSFTTGTNSTEFVSLAATEGETDLVSTNEAQLIRRPLTDRIKLLQFRYWGGTNWLESWNSFELPSGVEITLSKDPLPAEQAVNAESAAEDFPFEIFRRVVYLPNSVPPANRLVATEFSEY